MFTCSARRCPALAPRRILHHRARPRRCRGHRGWRRRSSRCGRWCRRGCSRLVGRLLGRVEHRRRGRRRRDRRERRPRRGRRRLRQGPHIGPRLGQQHRQPKGVLGLLSPPEGLLHGVAGPPLPPSERETPCQPNGYGLSDSGAPLETTTCKRQAARTKKAACRPSLTNKLKSGRPPESDETA